MAGTIERGTPNAAELRIHATDAPAEPCDGCTLLDLRRPLAAGNITAAHPRHNGVPGTLTVDTPVPVSTAWGQTSANIDITPNGQRGTLATVDVTLTHGALSTAGSILFGCDNFLDEVTPESVSPPLAGRQTVRARFRFSHPAGCPVFQGGPAGYLDLTAERRTPPGGSLLRTSYPILGATDPHTLVYRIYLGGGQVDTLYPGGHHFGITLPFAHLTRSRNEVRACADFGGPDLLGMLGQAIRISGADDPTFNGTFKPTAVSEHNDCLTWPQASPDSTSAHAKLSFGGAVGGLGAYTVWPGAEVTGVGIGNGQLDGTLRLAPNHVPWAAGDPVQQPHAPSVVVEGLGLDLHWNSPVTNAENLGISLSVAGVGVSANAAPLLITNRTERKLYTGLGGRLEPAQMGRFRGTWRGYFSFDQPTPHGSILEVYRGPDGCKHPGLDQYALWSMEAAGPTAAALFDCARNSLTTYVAGQALTENADGIRASTLIVDQHTPTPKTSCKAGQMWSDANFLYVCTADNVVKGVRLAALADLR